MRLIFKPCSSLNTYLLACLFACLFITLEKPLFSPEHVFFLLFSLYIFISKFYSIKSRLNLKKGKRNKTRSWVFREVVIENFSVFFW